MKFAKEQIANALTMAFNQACDELVEMKQTYFTVQGKSGWKPLTKNTIRIKKSKFPGNEYKFNVQTGKLRDSIAVDYVYMGNGVVRIEAFVDDADRANLTNYLTKTLGRDYLDIDAKEQLFLISRLRQLFIENLR